MIPNDLGNGTAMRTLSAAATLALLAGQVEAFEFLGLRSGMSAAEVQAAAPPGYKLGFFTEGSGALVRGEDFYATLAFCNGRLVNVIRQLDADTDWLPSVRAALSERGNPTVTAASQPWLGPGGGSVNSVTLSWYDGQAKYELSLTPEGRDGRGNLRHLRGASEAYQQVAGNSCLRPRQ